MPLLGSAALAMWWQIAPAVRWEFQHWHSHEHFPERMRVAGFRRGSRWEDAAGGEGFFVLYELAAYETLSSPAYLERLNHPTPWSQRMMPHHRNMVRSQCRVRESVGALTGAVLATIRLSPQPGCEDALHRHVAGALAQLTEMPGLAGGHLLQTDTPAMAPTREQQIRGGDAVADWIVLASGYDEQALREALAGMLGAAALVKAGAVAGMKSDVFRLVQAVTPADYAAT